MSPPDDGVAPPDDTGHPGAEDGRVPWWRSASDTLVDTADPVALHLAARNGVPTDRSRAGRAGGPDQASAPRAAEPEVDARAEPTGDLRDGGDMPPGTDGPARAGTSTDTGSHHGDSTGSDCDVCPICRGLAHVRHTHPELADHLVAAARHLTLAMREVVDTFGTGDHARAGNRATSDHDGATPHRGAADAGFESIPLDDMENEA